MNRHVHLPVLPAAEPELAPVCARRKRLGHGGHPGNLLQHPRMLVSSFIVYAASQIFDVWLYHKWWAFTERKTGDRRRFLWLRNNGSTLISQLLNSLLFTLFAFYGTYDAGTLLSIFASSYVIYIFTSLLDTPALYLARRIKEGKTAT